MSPACRDPAARRQVIVAADLIVEEGGDALTHRKIAARAEVSLGSTPQYFATLEELRGEALQLLVREADAAIEALIARVVGANDPGAEYADALAEYLDDARFMRLENQLLASALTRGAIWPVVQVRTDGLVERLVSTHRGAKCAHGGAGLRRRAAPRIAPRALRPNAAFCTRSLPPCSLSAPRSPHDEVLARGG